MTVHLSARLAWHDRGWDGCVCSDPVANTFCVVHDHIRDSRVDADEIAHAGEPLCEIGYRPPCSRDPGVYSKRGYTVTHRDPLDWRRLPSTDEDIPPYTAVTSPYGRMFADKGGWELDPEKQMENLKEFFSALTPKRSLVFFYLKDGQPFIETSQRIITGIGRIAKIGPQMCFGGPGDSKGNPYPVWSRAIVQNYPSEGFRLPLQEYIRNGYDVSQVLCLVPHTMTDRFSFVAEHVTDDDAVTIVEQLISSLGAVISENRVIGGWQQHLSWLEKVLSEVWHDRGPYPGLGSALVYLGCRTGISFQRKMTKSLSGSRENPWSFVEAILDGRTPITFPGHTSGLLEASARWRPEPEHRKALLRLLTRFELSPDHVERVMHPTKRRDSGILADEMAIIDNPYLLSELDVGGADSGALDFTTIDHGMLPSPEIADSSIQLINEDDDRRVRALLCTVLQHASEQGDTILPVDEACRSAERQLARERRCLPDPVRLEAVKDFFQQRLVFLDAEEGRLVGLQSLAADEALVRDRLCRMVGKTHTDQQVHWSGLVDSALLGVSERDSEDEANARDEKVAALRQAFLSRFSVITGRAGTGKTTIAGALIRGIESVEGKAYPLLLTPTGKARIRLQERTQREAKTIHQFLTETHWIDWEHNYILRREGGETKGAATVLIDESSMIPIDLLAALFRAIDWNQVRRLIMIGDPNQLPPIGPGRPFADIIAWLDIDDQRRERLVRLKYRGRFEDANSLGLQLSDGYTMGETSPADDETLAKIAIGRLDDSDVEAHYWEDTNDLNRILQSCICRLMLDNAQSADCRAIDASFRNKDGTVMPEAWQILSPVRRHAYGTDELNRLIQLGFRKDMIIKSKAREFVGRNHQLPRPAGDHQIVWNDKVIHTKNQYRRSWKEGTSGDQNRYVANGEVGIVTWAEKRSKGDQLVVVYGTQPAIRFKYYTGEVDDCVELAYALTVHKSQGSDFDTVFLVIPRTAGTISRELVYTALTRFKRKLVLLMQHDTRVLEQFRKPSTSETLLRNTNLFSLAIRPELTGFPYPENLLHRTATNTLVRSKSEVIVADTLTRFGISYLYEEPLYSKHDPRDFRLPDFTVHYEGDTWYWEHLGMLSVPSYASAWERKKRWYTDNGFVARVITSEDGSDGSISVPDIENKIMVSILQQ